MDHQTQDCQMLVIEAGRRVKHRGRGPNPRGAGPLKLTREVPGLISFRVGKLPSYSWRFNRSKRRRLGLGLPIGPFWHMCNLGLNLYTLPHEVVRRLHLLLFRHILVLRGLLRVRIGCWKRIQFYFNRRLTFRYIPNVLVRLGSRKGTERRENPVIEIFNVIR